QAKQENENEPRHNRGHRKREVDQADQEGPAAKLETRNNPSGRNAEHHIGYERDWRHGKRKKNRIAGVRIMEKVVKIDAETVAQSVIKDVNERHNDKHTNNTHCQEYQRPADVPGV